MEGKNTVNVAVIQHSCTEDRKKNVEKAKSLVRDAAEKGADIVCLQELFNGTYFCQSVEVDRYSLCEPVPGPVTEEMQDLARELGIVLIVPVYEYAMDGIYYNTAAVYDTDGTYLGKYRKTHIPDYPQYLEKFYFTPGDLGYKVFDTKYGRIGVVICWDEWFPEPSRILALKGADIIFYPSAIGVHDTDADMSQTWQDAIKAHGIHNNIFIAAPNRVGRETDGEEHLKFFGRSFISDPWGKILSEGSFDNDEIVMAECDLSEVRYARDVNAFFRDRRPETYGDILRRSIED